MNNKNTEIRKILKDRLNNPRMRNSYNETKNALEKLEIKMCIKDDGKRYKKP